MDQVCDGCHVDPVHAPRLYEGRVGHYCRGCCEDLDAAREHLLLPVIEMATWPEERVRV
jgi:hypothetical protein